MTTPIASAALLALAATLLLTPAVLVYAKRRGLIDVPGPRRSHDAPIARGGGAALAIGIIAGSVLLGIPDAAFLSGLLTMALLGWIDDHRPLPVRVRLPAQLLVAIGAVLAAGGVAWIQVCGMAMGPLWLWSPLAVLAVVWMINLFNFMDGSDGLAATQAGLSAGLMAVGFFISDADGYAGLAAVVAAAAVGFLAWNRPPASIFLGDAGSLALGFALGYLALVGTTTGDLPVMVAAIAVSPFVIDATATLASRLVSGGEWYTPHRDHAYQCLIRSGWSHQRVLLALAGINVAIVLPGFALAVTFPEWDGPIAAATGVMLLVLWRWARTRASVENRDV